MEAAFFDLDKTVVARSSSFALTRPMFRAGLVSRLAVLRSAYAQFVYILIGADERRMDRAKEAILRLSRGWDQAEVEELVRSVVIDLIHPYVYQEALDLMELHRSQGREVYIVSSSPQEVVRPLAEHFGVTNVIATQAGVENGKYTGELAFYCYGEGKAEAIRELAEREGIDLQASYAYSDSHTDLPMLEEVGNPVAVNPSRELRRAAEQRGWPVRDFRHPVPLRTRIGATTKRVSPVAAALTAAGVAAVVGWVYLRPRRREAS
ncbi:MAG: HAD family hydrolase [Actinomycetota bacterium]